jgi:hypothetical protein
MRGRVERMEREEESEADDCRIRRSLIDLFYTSGPLADGIEDFT